MNKTDSQLQRDVLDELKWEPSVDHEKIGVAVAGGVVTLSGTVPSYAEKLNAEKAARRVAGVKAIAENLTVRYPGDPKTGDAEIAKRIADVLDWDPLVPKNAVNITVEKGVAKLTGEVNWQYQRDIAFKAASKISGVTRIDNLIRVAPKVAPSDVRNKIEEAFERQADFEADKIQVRADGGKVILAGTVDSLDKRRMAERAAWSAAGVKMVDDRIVVT